MTKKDSPPAAIEGKEILVTALKISPSGAPSLTTANKIVFPLQASRRAVGTITCEIDPKVAQIRTYSDLNLGDEISGLNLWGFSSHPLKKGDIIGGEDGRSRSHPGQDVTLNGDFCFLEIVSGWRGSPLLTHPRNEILS
jgi:hypothetical protein